MGGPIHVGRKDFAYGAVSVVSKAAAQQEYPFRRDQKITL